MSNLHAAGLARRNPYLVPITPVALTADGVEWAALCEDVPTVAEDPADDADLERLIEGLRAL